MIYVTFKRSPFPCMSVRLNILPPDILFNILVVAAPTLGFLVFAETAIPINEPATLNAGFKSCLRALEYFFSLFFQNEHLQVETV